MNEEIINGVNVAECGYFNETDKECNICGMGTGGEDTFCRDCKDNSNCYYKQLKRSQKTLKHTENGKKVKAEKLKRIEEIVIHCIQGGFTDEFVQEIFDICREYEEV